MTTDKKRGIGMHGRSFVGTVISARMQKTATVEWERRVDLPKFERYMTKRTRVKAHNPESIRAEEGDLVRIRECRPLSKTKNFMIVEKLGKERGFAQRKEALEEGKKRVKEEDDASSEG